MVQKKDLYQIGEVAKQSNNSIDTIRYYEKIGLLAKPSRSVGGFRLYGKDAIEKLRFISKAQRFGLSLNEIRQVFKESDRGLEQCCSYVGKVLGKKLAELELKIRELHQMRKDLKSLMKGWIPIREARKKPFTICPQIENEKIGKKMRRRP